MMLPSKSLNTNIYQSIKAGDYWNADIHHQSTIVGDGIINDHRGEQIVVLVGNLQIGGLHKR